MNEDQSYRAMDLLIDADAQVQEAVFFALADLLDLEADLLFPDTTSTYFRTRHRKSSQRAAARGRPAPVWALRTEALTRLTAELQRIKTARARDAERRKAGKKAPSDAVHVKAECALRDHPTPGRWLWQLFPVGSSWTAGR